MKGAGYGDFPQTAPVWISTPATFRAGMMGFAAGNGVVPGVPDWLSLVVLILDILTIVFVVTGHKRFLVKVVWVIIVLALPFAGLILYFLLGREKA